MNGDLKEEVNTNLPEIVYHPQYTETEMVRFQKYVEEKYHVNFKDYWELHEWSCKYFPEFWECVWNFYDIVHSQPFSQVYDRKNTFQNMEWFKDARLNYSENILKYRDSKVALIAADNADNAKFITYEELYKEVRVYVEALKESGVKKGDVVISYMSNKVEAVFAFLATASIGAQWGGIQPLLGTNAILSRFKQVSPKVLLTAGNFYYEGQEVKIEDRLLDIVSGLSSLQKVVYIPSNSKAKVENISNIPKCVLLKEFLETAKKKLKDDRNEIVFEQVPFDYPLIISFTSGTTGPSKGLIHSHGSFIASLKNFGLHQSITRNDVLLNLSPGGWISWNVKVNTLHLGVTLCMYEGNPFDESPTRLWDLVDKFGLTSFYVFSGLLADMEKNGHGPTSKHSLGTLRQIFPMGSPVKPQCFSFLAEIVKPNLFCSPVYGSTEVNGACSGLNSNLPVYKGEIQLFSLGMDIRILDETETPVIGKRGNVVLANPYPGLFIKFLNDENGEQTKQLYLSQHPGYWDVSDEAWVNPVTKGFVVFGRNDETMNPKGARFSCSEIYHALQSFPCLSDSVCVSQYNSHLDERVILFVKLDPGHKLTLEVDKAIRQKIEAELSFEHVPDIIKEAPDVPYNLTGKKLNILVKKLINKKKVLNTEAVVNPSSIDFYRNVDLGNF